MENQDLHSPEEEEIIQRVIDEVSQNKPLGQNDAGPSQIINLPGSIPVRATSQLKTGISKSEHTLSLPHKNVASLNLTSTSLQGPHAQPIRTIDSKESNTPKMTKGTNREEVTLTDLKKFMLSYFKTNKDLPVVMSEVQNARDVLSNVLQNEVLQSIQVPDSSCVTSAQTDDINSIDTITLTNEVIVTNQVAPLEPKLSRCAAENKKKNAEKIGFPTAQRDSLSSIGSNVCRICMTRGRERLISPCNCKGSLANVHLTCLERWLNQVGRNHCELCGFSYPAIRTPRYTVLQALRLWFGNPRNRSHLQSDCLIFWLLSTVTAGLLAVCIIGAQYFVMEGNKFGKRHEFAAKDEGISQRITETAMQFFMAIVLCGYFVTVYLLCKDHYVMWNRWRRANVHVRLLLTPDSNPIPFVPRKGTLWRSALATVSAPLLRLAKIERRKRHAP